MIPTVIDYSFGKAQITPAAMGRVDGCIGGIAYAGCNDNAKNITTAQLHALLDANFAMALVIENFATDMVTASVGTSQGRAIVAAAKALGYDWQNCWLIAGYDSDSNSSLHPRILNAMEAFAAVVPFPGYYGDSDSIDYLHARHPNWFYWQSDSTSFSPKNPTPNAHILQLFNDPRAHGLPVDVNNVLKPLDRFMGAVDMPLTPDDANVLWNRHTVDLADGTNRQMDTAVAFAADRAGAALAAVNGLAAKLSAADDSPDIAALKSQVAAIAKSVADLTTLVKQGGTGTGGLTPQQMADQLDITVKP